MQNDNDGGAAFVGHLLYMDSRPMGGRLNGYECCAEQEGRFTICC